MVCPSINRIDNDLQKVFGEEMFKHAFRPIIYKSDRIIPAQKQFPLKALNGKVFESLSETLKTFNKETKSNYKWYIDFEKKWIVVYEK